MILPPAGRDRHRPAASPPPADAIAQLEQRRPGQRQRAVLRQQRRRSDPVPRRADVAHLVPQLQDQPLGGLLADARDRGEQQPRRLRPAPSCRLGRPPARQRGQRQPGPDLAHAEEQPEQLPLLLGGEAEELQGILAHVQMGEEQRLRRPRPARPAGSMAETSSRKPTPPTSTTTASPALGRHDVPVSRSIIAGSAARRHAGLAAGATPFPHAAGVGVADGHAQGVGGVVGPGRRRQAEQHPHHLHDLLLVGLAVAHHRLLDLLRRVLEHLAARLRAGQQASRPRAWPTASAVRTLALKNSDSTAVAVGLVLGRATRSSRRRSAPAASREACPAGVSMTP